MDDPITPCRFRQFAERRRKLIEQHRDGIILEEDLGFLPQPRHGCVIFAGRVWCRGQIVVDAREYLQIISIPPDRSFKDGIVSLETYGYHAFREGGPNICRFDGPHSANHPERVLEADSENHSHHDHQHVHLFDPNLKSEQKVLRIWPRDTPTLFGFLKNIHDWRFGVEPRVGGYEIRVWPFDS